MGLSILYVACNILEEDLGIFSILDMSCSRLVEFHKKDGIPSLNIYQRGPTVWTPIALRTRSKT